MRHNVLMLFVLVHSAQHDAPIDRRRGQKDKVKGHSVQQRGDFTPTTTAVAAVAAAAASCCSPLSQELAVVMVGVLGEVSFI